MTVLWTSCHTKGFSGPLWDKSGRTHDRSRISAGSFRIPGHLANADPAVTSDYSLVFNIRVFIPIPHRIFPRAEPQACLMEATLCTIGRLPDNDRAKVINRTEHLDRWLVQKRSVDALGSGEDRPMK